MDPTNNTNNKQLLFLSEFKELRKELSAMKKRIFLLEKSHEKQQEKLDILERENHALKKKTQLNNLNGNKEGEPALKRKRTDQDQELEKETESKSTSVSTSAGKKTKTNNNDDGDEEAAVIPQYDNGDSFDSLSDDLLHKVVEFDGNCYGKFGLINKRCRNIYDVKEYKLKKQTCLYGYGTVDMMLQHYLQKRRERTLNGYWKVEIASAVVRYNRLDAIDWIIQLGDINVLKWVCTIAAKHGRINILTKVFCKCNLATLDQLLNEKNVCLNASANGKLETLKWLRNHGAEWSARTFDVARDSGHDEIVQYLRAEGCPGTQDEDSSESSGGSNDEDGDY